MPSTAQLQHALSDLVAAEARRTPHHPSPEQLADFAEGLLTTADAEALRDHLVHCPACREELQSLARFAEITGQDDLEELPQPQTEAALARFRQHLRERELEGPLRRPNADPPLAEVKPFPVPAEATPRADASRWASPRVAQLLAASLALAVVGLGGSSLYFRNEAKSLASAEVNPPRVVLMPHRVLRSDGKPEEALVPRDARRFLLTFDSSLLGSLPRKVPVELCATFEGGGLKARQRICGALEVNAVDRFSISLTRDMFPAGHYTVKLVKTVPPPEELLEQYPMTIQ